MFFDREQGVFQPGDSAHRPSIGASYRSGCLI